MTETTDHVLAALLGIRDKAVQTRDAAALDVARIDTLIKVHAEQTALHQHRDGVSPLPGLVVDSRAEVASLMTARFCPDCGEPVDDASGHLMHTKTGQLHCGPADPDATGVHHVPDGAPQAVPDRQEVPGV